MTTVSTLEKIQATFNSNWFHISELGAVNGLPKTLGIQATCVAELVANGSLEYHPNSTSMGRVVITAKQDSITALRSYFASMS